MDGADDSSYPFSLPVVRNLDRLKLESNVTFLVGENGTGKSTLLEAIAINYGFNPGKSLHEQSHGESFMALLMNRFYGNGLYLLDEPESALSPSRQMALLARMYDLVKQNSQFIIATHSPILLAYPGAQIFVLKENGITLTPYEETEHYVITKQFLNNPDGMLKYLMEE